MNTKRKILKNLGVLTIGKVLAVLLGLVSSAYLARVLGPKNFGVLGFATAFFIYFRLIVSLGFDRYGVREIARDPTKIGTLASQIISMRLLLSIVSIALYVSVVLLIDKPFLVKLVLFIHISRLIGVAIQLDFAFQGVQRMGVIATRQVAAAVANFTGIVLLVHRPEDVVIAAAIAAGSIVLNDIWLLVRFLRELAKIHLHIDLDAWRQVLKASLPLAMTGFMVAIYYQMDVLMLGFIRSEEETGLYVAAYKIHTGVIIAPQLIFTSFLPALSKEFGNIASMRKRMRQYARMMLIVGAFLPIMCMVYSHEIMLLIFGGDYVTASTALIILMANAHIIYLNVTVGSPLVAWDKQLQYMYVVAAGAVVNIILNFILIPRYGIEGAAVATLCSEVTVLCGLCWLHYRVVRQLYVGLLVKVGICVVVAIALVKLIALSLPVSGGILVGTLAGASAMFLVYAAMILIVRVVTIKELLVLYQELKRKLSARPEPVARDPE